MVRKSPRQRMRRSTSPMPLMDHFHPPLSLERRWEAFHGWWAAVLAETLNRDWLPPEYFAEFQVHVGGRIEVEVATFETVSRSEATPTPGIGTVALAAPTWAPPAPDLVLTLSAPETVEVLVFSREAGPELVAAIELVSPRNKDRPEARRAFAIKCADLLNQGVGLVVVDVVTNRRADLAADLRAILGTDSDHPQTHVRHADRLVATAYRPILAAESGRAEVWVEPLSVGQSLPTLPLALDAGRFVPLDLETTYMEACRRGRLPWVEPSETVSG